MKNKKSFLIHKDSLGILDELTNEQCGELFKAIRDYQNGKEIKVSAIIKIAFVPFKAQFERDEEKYETIVKRNKANGSKGGRPKNPVGYLETQTNPNKPKKADSDSDSDSDNKKTKAKKFVPPTVDEVAKYCLERHNSVNPESFVDHYAASGWMRGKNKIKDWKACVRTWEKNSNNRFVQDNTKSWKGAI